MPYRQALLNYTAGLLFTLLVSPALANTAGSVAAPDPSSPATTPDPSGPATTDSVYKNWYFTPTGVYGRLPLEKTKYRAYVKVSHPSPEMAIVQSFNPANVLVNTTRVYFRNGLIRLSTETDRWGDTYDSTWYQPEGQEGREGPGGQGKFLVTERKRGVNPYLPCKYLEYTFKDGLVTDILCFIDSIRAGNNQDGVAHYVFERYNDPERRGLIRTETFLSNIDMPAFSRTADCHRLVNDYDAKGNLASRSIYDQDGKPILDRYGVFRARYKYDGDDNETDADYFDTGDRITVTAWNYSSRGREYKHGFLTAQTYYFDVTTIVRSSRLADSVAVTWFKYDQDGNETETTYYDQQNSPINNAFGVQKIENLYSSAGLLTRRSMIPINATSGVQNKIYFSVNYTRDDKGRITGQSYQSNTGVLMPNPENGATLPKYSYDASGRTHSTSCWQNDSTMAKCSLGYHEVVARYDNDGQITERDFFDENGEPSTGTIGYSKEQLSFNEQGLLAGRAFYAGDKPVGLHDDGAAVSNFHRMEYHYDLLNRLRSINFFDEAGRPVDAVLRPDNRRQYKALEIDLDYKGALLVTETMVDTGDAHPPVALNCATGQCQALSDFEGPRKARALGAATPVQVYHGKFQPERIFANRIGFLGQDSVFVFINENWLGQTDLGCSKYYRVAPVNKYYQLDGRVTDYYIDNDSVAASFNYEHGTLEGPAYFYYPNGVIKEHGTYQNNVKSGVWDYYYDNGQKERTLQYQFGGVVLVDCYTRNGDALARDGNGRFEGMIASGTGRVTYELLAKGNVKDGVPDGEWNLYSKQISGPANTEYFSNGKFHRGISNSLSGKLNYTDKCFTNLEGIHTYEILDHYQEYPSCRAIGMDPLYSDLFPEIRQGVTSILSTNQYSTYSGWVFLDVKVSGAGRILSTDVRLHQQNDAFAKDIRDMAARLTYPASSKAGDQGASYEKLYIILVEANHVVIPEEVLQSQRNIFH
jgi:antitoxin component YwqK of YwqJK toxin-antitoxin module